MDKINGNVNESIGRPEEIYYNSKNHRATSNTSMIPHPCMHPASDLRIEEIFSVYDRFDKLLHEHAPIDLETRSETAARLTELYFSSIY